MASSVIIIDTSVFIDHLRTNCYTTRIESLNGLIRNSAVVLSELWRGATKPAEQRFLRTLQRNHPILSPTEKNWLESGQILGRIHEKAGFSGQKLRELHFDVLIALTARGHGARLITSNRTDFTLIHSYRAFDLEVW